MLERMRRAIGADMYVCLVIIFNFAPVKMDSAEELRRREQTRQQYRVWLFQQEMNLFNWSRRLQQAINATIQRVPMLFVDMNPEYLKEASHSKLDMKLGSPYVEYLPPF